jgi:ATP-dependent Clp protease adaptor protein ClpS
MSTTDTLEKTDTIIMLDETWKILFHNDNVTTVEFVAHLLIQYFKIAPEEAIELTYKIHDEGRAVVKEYSNYDIAEQKVTEATQIARSYGYPLKITLEK